MEKEMNLLVLLPGLGSAILYFWLFIEVRRGYINGKKLKLYFFLSGLVGIVSTLLCLVPLLYLNSIMNIADLLTVIAPFIVQAVSGYIVNIFTFILINAKWDDLNDIDIDLF